MGYALYKKLRDKFYWIVFVVCSIGLDALLVSSWVIIQYCADTYIVAPLDLRGVDNKVLLIFQIILAISTIVPIFVFIVTDVMIVSKLAWHHCCKQKTKKIDINKLKL